MKKTFTSLLCSVWVLFLLNCITTAFAQSYTLTVDCPYGFRYYGDYAGIVNCKGTIKIGPYAQPFTVTLIPLVESLIEKSCIGSASIQMNRYSIGGNWTVNGVVTGKNPTVTVDTAYPQTTAVCSKSIVESHSETFSLIDQSIAATFCNPASYELVGSTFTMYYNTVLNILPSDTVMGVNIAYDPRYLQLISVGNTSGDAFLIQPGLISNYQGTAGFGSQATFTWKALAEGDTTLTTTIHDQATGNPIMSGAAPMHGYPAELILRKAQHLFGDVNNDDRVDIVDALQVAQAAVNYGIALDKNISDVNLDGSITIVDALIIAQYSVNLIDTLPVIK